MGISNKVMAAFALISVLSNVAIEANSCGVEDRKVKEDKVTARMEIGEENELTKSLELPVADEKFKLVCEFDTGKYDVYNWHVTDDKSIKIKAYTKGLPKGYEVYIDHMHADINIKSTHESLNGIPQDSMDNSSHTYPTDGFYIDDDMSYDRTFSIEGYAKDFYEMCGSRFADYGYVSGEQKRVTESLLIEKGVCAQKLHVVFDLNIRKEGSEHFYTTSVESEILIPVSGAYSDTTDGTETSETQMP